MAVVVPYLGDRAGADELLRRLSSLRLAEGDEVVVCDNSPERVVEPRPGVRVVHAGGRRSAYHARNAGARAISAPWLLFLDADCGLPPELIEAYFDRAPGPRCGVIAGEVAGEPGHGARLARWADSRRGAIASRHLADPGGPAGVSANLLVRRDAFERVGGYAEVRSDADIDLCWRIQEAGWELERRPGAIVTHRHPERLGDMLRQAVGYGAGRRWLRSRHGARVPPAGLVRPLARAFAGVLVHAARRDPDRVAWSALDAANAVAFRLGYAFADNEPREP